jgi:transposase
LGDCSTTASLFPDAFISMEEHPMPISRRPPRTRSRRPSTPLERINANVAGIDCGATHHVVAVPPDRATPSVQTFPTVTSGLRRLVDWLVACKVTSVAMEATGVYWIPIYELLEEAGLEVLLVNARHFSNVPGRKSDVSDCEWLRDLHSVGLLRGSFRPRAAIVTLRAYLRHRQILTESAATYVQRMQKALVQMNLQLPVVVSDIAGRTGLRIIRDIVAGQRDPHTLATHRDPRCQASQTALVEALTGSYRPEHIFALRQNLALYDACQTQLAECDATIATQLATLTHAVPRVAGPVPAPRVIRTPRGHEPRFEIRTPLHQLTGGVDLTQIDGIAPHTALKLISEIGLDVTRWPTEKHFTSWLTLAPRNKISGGRLLSSRTQPSGNRAAGALRMAALTVARTETALGASHRRLAARIGKPQALTATARKLAVLVYRALKGDLVYQDPGPDAYALQQRTRTLRRLRQRAGTLGYQLVNQETGEILEATT